LAFAIVLLAGSAVTARAQMAPWPDAPRPQPQTAPWPGSPQPAPPQSPWPGGPQQAPQAAPQQGGWPASPQPAMGAPSGPPMGAGPTPEQADCMREFQVFRQEVEKRGLAAKAAGESHKASREEMCKLVTAYSGAEAKWIKYSADNMSKCGIPREIVDQIKKAHAHTDEARTKICSAGPAGGGGGAPSLSDALGTSRLPSQETERRKAGTGTLDTLTGNALGR
jgi:hypothetical protein